MSTVEDTGVIFCRLRKFSVKINEFVKISSYLSLLSPIARERTYTHRGVQDSNRQCSHISGPNLSFDGSKCLRSFELATQASIGPLWSISCLVMELWVMDSRSTDFTILAITSRTPPSNDSPKLLNPWLRQMLESPANILSPWTIKSDKKCEHTVGWNSKSTHFIAIFCPYNWSRPAQILYVFSPYMIYVSRSGKLNTCEIHPQRWHVLQITNKMQNHFSLAHILDKRSVYWLVEIFFLWLSR